MAQQVMIPRLGQTMTQGTIVKWLMEDGAAVQPGDELLEMEYDKATTSLLAEKTGTLKILKEAGASYVLGTVIAVVIEEGERFEDIKLRDATGTIAISPSVPVSRDKKQGAAAPVAAAAPEKVDADVLVIGGGPGGYVAALKLGMLGASVILVEKDRVGGTCLNCGCIPTKALLQSVEALQTIKDSASMGISVRDVSFDAKAINDRKQGVVDTLVRGVEGLLRARNVQVVKGTARFAEQKLIEVTDAAGARKTYRAKNIIIATGSRSSTIPVEGVEGRNVITSTEALNVDELPQSLAIIGGGVIGLEVGTIYAGLGVQVSVVEAMDHLLPNMDVEVSEACRDMLSRKMEVYTSARVSRVFDTPEQRKGVTFTVNGASTTIVADKVLLSTGRTAEFEDLGLSGVGIETGRGCVAVNSHFETNVPGVFCIGDANAKMMLAHVASAQGVYVAERIMGQPCSIHMETVPSCVYTDPEIASVGMTQQQVEKAGIPHKVGRFPFYANGKALAMNKGEGFVKLIAGTKDNEILGVHIVGPRATDMIGELSVAMNLEGCVENLAQTIHPHPTLSEAIMEAAEAFLGGAIHNL